MTRLIPIFVSLGFAIFTLQATELENNEKLRTESTQEIYKSKNFEYLLGKITGLDDALLKMHFKLYEGYVNNTNLILQKLQNLTNQGLNKTPEFAALKRILGWEYDGMVLHEYYFENLGGSKFLETDDPLMQKMINDFGSFEKWKADFISTGLMRGIGWVIAYIEPKSGRLVNEWINEHDLGHLAGGTPIVIMDVFEHAYITQFGLNRGKYIEIFFENLNWQKASERFRNRK